MLVFKLTGPNGWNRWQKKGVAKRGMVAIPRFVWIDQPYEIRDRDGRIVWRHHTPGERQTRSSRRIIDAETTSQLYFVSPRLGVFRSHDNGEGSVDRYAEVETMNFWSRLLSEDVKYFNLREGEQRNC